MTVRLPHFSYHSSAHTLGRARFNSSGFEGPWTRDPLSFDNGCVCLCVCTSFFVFLPCWLASLRGGKPLSPLQNLT